MILIRCNEKLLSGGGDMSNKQLRDILLTARQEKRLTQEDVVSLSKENITRQYYGMIENGERKPSVKIAKSISEVLSIDWTIFFEINGNEKLHKKA